MSGHSKWSTIKHKKGALDQARSSLFQKLTREIYVAAKSGDSDPANNSALRLVIEKAKAMNMPNDNINKAVEKARGNNNSENFEAVVYEGYGPNGIAIMALCLTDNRNRTASIIRSTFSKKNGNLGTDGSVSYMFKRRGVIVIPKTIDEDIVMECVLENGAIDFKSNEDNFEIYTEVTEFIKSKEALEKLGINDFIVSEVTFVPDNTVKLDDENTKKVMNLIETLEDIDDVQNVYHNLEM